MKIIQVDNFDREYIDDVLIATNVAPGFITTIVDALNEKHSGESSSYFFKAVSDDYVLFTFTP